MLTEYSILCLNSGSSSLKFALYQTGNNKETLLAEGIIERIGLQDGHLWISDAQKKVLADIHDDFPNHRAAVGAAFAAFEQFRLPQPAAVGHRVVHGGPHFTTPVILDSQLLDKLRGLIPFAPLHLPSEIQGIEAINDRFPGLPQVACFDTAFHRRMPELSKRFPLPRSLWDEGLQRYGFHGLSYEYIMETLGPAGQGRTIIAHLGNGASLAAVWKGRPLDTTMGFTPAGGFMMGTRSGDLDPGILLYLMREKGYAAPRIDYLVNHQSGLLGISGISPDMKLLLEKRESEPAAKQAVEMFCYQLRKQIGALAAALGGLDTLVFTGGIGEKAAPVRASACQGLEFLGIQLDAQQNETHSNIISTAQSSCRVMVIPTNEDLMIARHTHKLISPAGNHHKGALKN
jgi:acetate kinase